MSAGCRVHVERVVRRYAATDGTALTVLNGVSMDVPAGTSIAIVGPSGCGKSTLLAILSGLEVPDTGTVALDDIEVSSLTEPARAAVRRSRIGFVFQNDNLEPFLTAAENVEQQAALSGSLDGPVRARELLADLGVEDLQDRLPDQLSGGQRQRVAVARALVHRPALLVADEPTGALDPVASARVVALLGNAQQHLGATLVVVSHDPEVAAALDRTMELSGGQLSEPGRV